MDGQDPPPASAPKGVSLGTEALGAGWGLAGRGGRWSRDGQSSLLRTEEAGKQAPPTPTAAPTSLPHHLARRVHPWSDASVPGQQRLRISLDSGGRCFGLVLCREKRREELCEMPPRASSSQALDPGSCSMVASAFHQFLGCQHIVFAPFKWGAHD